MRKRNFGFTLIELLVVIVIIGILATISTATFKSYFGRARDAERQAAIQNMALMIKVDGADNWRNGKYKYDYIQMIGLMNENDYRVPTGKNDICYFIGMAQTKNSLVGDENEFVVATWGEHTSSGETGEEGILLDGTQQAMEELLTAGLDEDDFSCTNTPIMLNVRTAFDELPGVPDTKYLYIDEEGTIYHFVDN